MKTYRQIYQQAKDLSGMDKEAINLLLWRLLCYPPKMPLRVVHQELLNKAEPFSLTVSDDYFSKEKLLFNGFKWGNGETKILVTHGWSSKAADLSILIEMVAALPNVQVIAFDAPGNGSSAAELSNLFLYIESIKEIIKHNGNPDIVIGHSLGAMANIIALQQLNIHPKLLISIAPVIKLKALFTNIMDGANVSPAIQDEFFISFESTFKRPVTDFDLDSYYSLQETLNHWIAYDESDTVVDSGILEDFLKTRPFIDSENYPNVRHEGLIKHLPLINQIEEKCGHS